MSETVEKEALAQMCYFTTIRPKTDVKYECVEALRDLWINDKKIQQFALVIEKQSKGVPCTHHV